MTLICEEWKMESRFRQCPLRFPAFDDEKELD